MSKTQDVFGAAPKSVLNKPMMHVQDRRASGEIAQTQADAGVAVTDREYNSVIVNEIPGASLSANQITLPAGTYFIDASTSLIEESGGTSFTGRQFMVRDAATDAPIITGMSQGVREFTGPRLAAIGQFTLAATTTIKFTDVGEVITRIRYGLPVGGDYDEVYGDVFIWKLDSNVETPVISDPTMTLARPLMHVQDQKPTGTDGGSLTGGVDNDRDLNTILTNEISGASLSSNEITLPAGEYYVDAYTETYYPNGPAVNTIRKSDDTLLLRGANIYGAVVASHGSSVSGRITLTETTAIKLSTYTTTTRPNSGGVTSSIAPYEVYSDFKIWQLDAVNKQPVLVNDKLYPLPGNVIVTGNMHGLEYEYTTANIITVQAGICMDSVNETVLQLTNPQLVTIPSGVNTVYNLFLTDDGQLVKTDTDVDGANLPVQDKRRWIGFVTTDGAGAIHRFQHTEDEMGWVGEYGVNLSGGIDLGDVGPAGFTKLSIASAAPVSRVIKADVMIGVPTNVHCIIKYGEYYYSADQGPTAGGATISARVPVINGEVEGYAGAGTAPMILMGVRMRR